MVKVPKPGEKKDKSKKDKDKKKAKAAPPPPPPMQKVDVPPGPVLSARAHFSQNLGTPTLILDLRGKKPLERLEVAVFEPPSRGAPLLVTTVGACQVPMKDGRYFEGVLMVKPAPPKDRMELICKLMASLATYPVQYGVSLGAGAIIHSEAEIRKTLGMDVLMALPPVVFAPGFATFRRPDQKAVELLWMVPLHKSEADYADKHGPKKLMDRLTELKVDIMALDRPPADFNAAPPKPAAAKPGVTPPKPGVAPPKPGAPVKPGAPAPLAAKSAAAPVAARPGVAPLAKPGTVAPKAPVPVKK